MAIEHKLHRVQPNSPDRCQGSYAGGQCPYQKVPGSDYCPRCGGYKALESQKKEAVRNYRITQWQSRVNEFADNDQIKSLREEIGILRMTLETVLNRCQSNDQIFLYTGRIADLTMKIEKLVGTCSRMELSSGQTLDKTKAMNFAAAIVEIIGRYIPNVEIVDAIANEIIASLLTNTETPVET